MFASNLTDKFNEKFSSDGSIIFEPGPGGLPLIRIANSNCAALVSIYGAHVMSYIPHGFEDLLWLSSESFYDEGKPIRGGIPVCWPWFGGHPSDKDKPAHGFARISMWELVSVKTDLGVSEIVLELTDDDKSRFLWPQSFKLRAVIKAGARLEVALTTENTSLDSFKITQALHTYFSISEIGGIGIKGFDGLKYIDTLKSADLPRQTQYGTIGINTETDFIFVDTQGSYVIEDPGFKRKIDIAKSGSNSAVVWNPWAEKAKKTRDFGNEEYHSMVCVEVTNTSQDCREIAPGACHTISTVISASELY